MIASDPIRCCRHSCKPGAVHIWVLQELDPTYESRNGVETYGASPFVCVTKDRTSGSTSTAVAWASSRVMPGRMRA